MTRSLPTYRRGRRTRCTQRGQSVAERGRLPGLVTDLDVLNADNADTNLKSRMCGPQVRSCERGSGRPESLLDKGRRPTATNAATGDRGSHHGFAKADAESSAPNSNARRRHTIQDCMNIHNETHPWQHGYSLGVGQLWTLTAHHTPPTLERPRDRNIALAGWSVAQMLKSDVGTRWRKDATPVAPNDLG